MDILDEALDGQNLDEVSIVKVLCNCDSMQRSELKKLFKAKVNSATSKLATFQINYWVYN